MAGCSMTNLLPSKHGDNAEEADLIGKECVVKQPSFQILNGRGL